MVDDVVLMPTLLAQSINTVTFKDAVPIPIKSQHDEDMVNKIEPETFKEVDKLAPEATQKVEELGMKIGFMRSGEKTELVFKKGPLGLTFKNKMPLVVNKVLRGSAAAELGVEVGWVFETVSGVSLGDKSFEEVSELLKAGSMALPKA